MSRMEATKQDLFLRLGTTSQSRSVRADALFRRLRSADHAPDHDDHAEQIAAPRPELLLSKSRSGVTIVTPSSD